MRAIGSWARLYIAQLRWVLILIALGIDLPAILVVLRATEALDLEEANHHETIAERIFDEMERSLSDFLVREESRPADDHHDPTSGTAGSQLGLPPQFTEADEPFIVGWFVLPMSEAPLAVARNSAARARIESAMRIALIPPAAQGEGRAVEQSDHTKLGARAIEAPAPGRTSSIRRARKREAKRVEYYGTITIRGPVCPQHEQSLVRHDFDRVDRDRLKAGWVEHSESDREFSSDSIRFIRLAELRDDLLST